MDSFIEEFPVMLITVALEKQCKDIVDNADWTALCCESHGGYLAML